MSMNKSKKAFTLVELLVVIAIIALLLSILMPALGRVRQQAQSVVCSTHLKQLSLGLILYSNEYNNKTVWVSYPSVQWIEQIAPYMGDKKASSTSASALEKAMKVAMCPSANKTNKDALTNSNGRATNKTAWNNGRFAGSYAINGWLESSLSGSVNGSSPTGYILSFYDPKATSWPTTSQPTRFYQNLSEAKSMVPVFGDAVWSNAFPFRDLSVFVDERWVLDYKSGAPISGSYFHSPFSADDTRNTQMGRFQIDRHKMSVNLGFVDGHVQNVKLQNLWSFPWNKRFDAVSNVPLPKTR